MSVADIITDLNIRGDTQAINWKNAKEALEGAINGHPGTDLNLQVVDHAGTLQLRAVNDAVSAFIPLLFDATNINFNSISGGTETHTGLSTFHTGITVDGGTLIVVSQDNGELYWDEVRGMLGAGTNTPFADNNLALGAVVRDDNNGPTRLSVVNQSTGSSASSQFNLNLGSPTGFNFTLEALTIGGTPYAIFAVDNTIPAWAGMFFAAPEFVWENQAQDTNWLVLSSASLTSFVKIIGAASTTSAATLNVPSGTAPTSPNNGDIWFDGSNLKIRISGATKTFTVT